MTEQMLFFTSCNISEFSCHVGICIPINMRCDGKPNCPDNSDELSCRTLYWLEKGQDSYTRELPPTPYIPTRENRLPISLSATILNVLELKELEEYWHPKVRFEMRWFDQRLQMQNLKHNSVLNVLADEERKIIWFPEIILGNNDENLRLILDEKAFIVVKREGLGVPNSLDDLVGAEIFNGHENPFLYKRTYSHKFECTFHLQSYPFDTQECAMILVVPVSQRQNINITAVKVRYKGLNNLHQFMIKSPKVFNMNNKALFVIRFQRKFYYHLISVYIPTLSLSIISLVTLHIDIKHFDSTIMVHLTTMLVFYTLFQSISETLPRVLNCILLKEFLYNVLDCLHQTLRYLASLWPAPSFPVFSSDSDGRNIDHRHRRCFKA